jgi:hypothetical protein
MSRIRFGMSVFGVAMGIAGVVIYNDWVFAYPGRTPFIIYLGAAVLQLIGWEGVVSELAAKRKKWTAPRVLKAVLLVMSLTLLGLSAADMVTVWTIGFNPAVQSEVSTSFVIEGVDFRLLVTQLTFGALAGALAVLVDMIEKGLIPA